MTMTMTRGARRCGWLLALVMTALPLAGCVTAPQPVVQAQVMPFEQAAQTAVDGLLRQGDDSAGLFGAKPKVLVLDPTIDGLTGQQTAATQVLDRIVAQRVRERGSEALRFDAQGVGKATHLVVGTMTRADKAYQLNLALVDLGSRTVVAQSSARASAAGVDMTPLAMFRDSPVLPRDRGFDGYVKTASTAPKQPADAAYLDRLAGSAQAQEAMALYAAGRFREALTAYRAAAVRGGDQIRVLTGVYLSSVKAGTPAEAEEAFGQLVALGLSTNSVSVKFLFAPGSTDFWPDPKVTAAYSMWMRQIAAQLARSSLCVRVQGHTSATGSEAFNEALSTRRAATIRGRLVAQSPALEPRLRVLGLGSKENIVGTGTDDVVDAADRRVDFRVVGCDAG